MYPLVKPQSFNPIFTQKNVACSGNFLSEVNGQIPVQVGNHWLHDLDPGKHRTFVGLRQENLGVLYCLVTRWNPKDGILTLMPLPDSQTPLDILKNGDLWEHLKYPSVELTPENEKRLISLSLEQAIQDRLLSSPLPFPRRVFGVAYNLPSHLQEDLRLKNVNRFRSDFAQSRSRVFLKHPFTAPPILHCAGMDELGAQCLGPYDPIVFPSSIHIPSCLGESESHWVPTSADYEVEIGAVMGDNLTWDKISKQSDEEIEDSIAGFVLISDTKARNPQLMGKLMSNRAPSEYGVSPYRFSRLRLNRMFGGWNRSVCQWWSYAASYGNYTAIGPLFVSSDSLDLKEGIGLLSARKYAVNTKRGEALSRIGDSFFLRQSSVITQADEHPEKMIWNLAPIIRSILDPMDNALAFNPDNLQLEAGDIIMLGTPGGTVLTGKPQWQIDLLQRLFFWRTPKDWHDWICSKTQELYLDSGDEIFFFAESLGYQLHLIETLEV